MNFFKNIIQDDCPSINGLNQDGDQRFVCPDLDPIRSKGYQQMTKIVSRRLNVKSLSHNI